MDADRVTVVTVNRGGPVVRNQTVVTWHGEIGEPSLVGPGCWNVRRDTKSGIHGAVYAVPDGEIRLRNG